MRIIGVVAFVLGCGFPWNFLRAADIHVEEVSGQVWYNGAKGAVPLHSQINLPPGSLVTDVDGWVYASPFPGSKIRLAPTTTVQFESNQIENGGEGNWERNAVLHLTQGKITGEISPRVIGECCYDIQIEGGRISAKQGIFVVCVHGDGAHIYVARGFVTVYPKKGIYHQNGIRLVAKASIGILSSDGELQFQRMNSAAIGMDNCLLSGLTPEILQHLEMAEPNPANLKGNMPISPIE